MATHRSSKLHSCSGEGMDGRGSKWLEPQRFFCFFFSVESRKTDVESWHLWLDHLQPRLV